MSGPQSVSLSSALFYIYVFFFAAYFASYSPTYFFAAKPLCARTGRLGVEQVADSGLRMHRACLKRRRRLLTFYVPTYFVITYSFAAKPLCARTG